MKDFYWDIRPKPEYGTIELRICDTPLTVEKAAALAAFAQTLALQMLREPGRMPDERLYLPYRYNRFNAARYGLSGEFIDAVTGAKQELGEMICQTIDGLWELASEIGTTRPLKLLYESAVTRRNDADRLRSIYQETRSFNDVAHASADIWSSGRLAEGQQGAR
jgi:carboxylate-amine ligase